MLHRSTFSSDSHCRTQMHLARQGVVSPEMWRVAEREQLPANVHHVALDPMAIGLKARVKINANIGNSPRPRRWTRRSRSSHWPNAGAPTR